MGQLQKPREIRSRNRIAKSIVTASATKLRPEAPESHSEPCHLMWWRPMTLCIAERRAVTLQRGTNALQRHAEWFDEATYAMAPTEVRRLLDAAAAAL